MADIEGRIRIKRGDLSNRSESTISAGTPIIDTNTKELYISTSDTSQLLNCGIRVKEAKNIIEGGKIAGNVVLGTTTETSTTGNRHPDNIFEMNSNTVKNSTNVTTKIKDRAISDIFDNIAANNSVKNAVNVTTNINNHPITTIFEDNGTTVKDATNVTSSINGHLLSEIFQDNGKTVRDADKSFTSYMSEYSKNSKHVDLKVSGFLELEEHNGGTITMNTLGVIYRIDGLQINDYFYGNIYLDPLTDLDLARPEQKRQYTNVDVLSISFNSLKAAPYPSNYDIMPNTAGLLSMQSNENHVANIWGSHYNSKNPEKYEMEFTGNKTTIDFRCSRGIRTSLSFIGVMLKYDKYAYHG